MTVQIHDRLDLECLDVVVKDVLTLSHLQQQPRSLIVPSIRR